MKKTIEFLTNLLKDQDKIVLGLSGGPDSILLFNILLSFREKKYITLICAHVNHNLREESKEEQEFVQKLCEQNNCIFETIDLNLKTKTNLENQARKKRYAFFDKIVEKYQANYLMTAHHGDDLIETILMHLVRGSNLNGYAGFKKINKYNNYTLIRPLIYLTKEEIIQVCTEKKLEYRIDKTNENMTITRNRYRKNILPFLKEENKSVHQKFLKFSEELEQIEKYLQEKTENSLTRVYDFDKVNLREFNKLDLLIKKRVIEYILKKEYQDNIIVVNDKHLKSILEMSVSEKPNLEINMPLGRTFIKSYEEMYFLKKEENILEELILEDYLKINENEELIKVKETNIIKSNFIIRLNTKEIELPLRVRTRKEHDFIEIKNLKVKKKIKDVFINEKIPKNRRENYPLVVDNKERILWIPGLKKSKFDKNINEFYDIIYKYVISEEKNNEKK